nr:hypothetical protein [Tanacetum cinerariifolium]
AKKEWGLSPKAKVRVLHTAQLDVTVSLNSVTFPERIASFVGDVDRPASALYDRSMTETSSINNVSAEAVSFLGGCVPDDGVPESRLRVVYNVFHE